MATLHTQILPMTWGTFLSGSDPYATKVGLAYMDLTETNARPLMMFNGDAFHGQIVSATISLYQTHYALDNSWFDLYRVKIASNNQATWVSSGVYAWNGLGCSSPDDHSLTSLANHRTAMSANTWYHLSITSLPELTQAIESNDAIVFIYTGIDKPIGAGGSVRFSKVTNYTPYLTINYTTSLLGGVQIF